MSKKRVGIMGVGALGGIIGRTILNGDIKGATLSSVFDISDEAIDQALGVDGKELQAQSFDEFIQESDIVVEALPPEIAASYIPQVLKSGKTLIALTLSVFVTQPELFQKMHEWPGKLIVPPGSIAGLDGVAALAKAGILSARIRTSKPPPSLISAPFVQNLEIDLNSIEEKQKLFEGNVKEGAKGFPANVNVAAALALTGIGPEKTTMEVWADPLLTSNRHEVKIESKIGDLTVRLDNRSDPSKPSSSMLAAYSVLSKIQEMT